MASSRRALPKSFVWEDFTFDHAAMDAGIRGGQGLVVSALHKSKAVFAVKITDLTRYDTENANLGVVTAVAAYEGAEVQAANEAAIATSLTHAFIVPTLGSFTYNGRMFMVMKQLHGHLAVDAILGTSGRVALSRHVLSQMAFALEHMHHLDVTHGDLKPDNVLEAANGNTALCDFGISSHRHRCAPVAGELGRIPMGECATMRAHTGFSHRPLPPSPSLRRHSAVYASRGPQGIRGARARARPRRPRRLSRRRL